MNNIQALAVTNEDVRFLLQENETLKLENSKLHAAQRDADYYSDLSERLRGEIVKLKRENQELKDRVHEFGLEISYLQEELDKQIGWEKEG
jgi:predicted RNase H-like nuclease (RuvC/YqgF family)